MDFLALEPELDPGESILHRAYHELSTCRPIGMSLGPIPWLAMLEWASYHELGRTETDLMINILRRVDAETMRRQAETQRTK